MIKRLLLLALLTGFSWSVFADTDTTATLKGSVNVTSGTVTAVYEPTGLTKSQAIGTDGHFAFSFMPIGGPYKVTVESEGYKTATISGVQLAVYQNTPLRFDLATSAAMEEVVVTGTKIANAQGFGTGTTLDRAAIENVPTASRAIADYVNLDPRIEINAEDSRNLEISAMGANSRFNDFQIDGVSFNDPFGLNANGFGTMRNPISMDFVDQIAVDITPYDVTRGNATGASISVVTKSGSNDFHGSIYYTKRDESQVGDQPNGSAFPPFDEKEVAVTFSGPIIQDKLFFFLGYDKFDRSEPYNYGPAGSGALNESYAADASVFQQIADIAKNTYGFDPGGFQNLSFPETHKEYSGKIDYVLNDSNRIQLDYSNSKDLLYQGVNRDVFENTVYSKPPKITRGSVTWYSDLTSKLHFKAKYTNYHMKENDSSKGGDFPYVTVRYDNGTDYDDIHLGGELYRAVNYIDVDSDFYTAKFDYDAGAHLFTFGMDYEKSHLINEFLARYNGDVQFDSIADFAAGNWSYLRFQVPTAGLTDINSISANFSVRKTTLYAQDSWQATPELTVQYGLRYDMVKTPTKPVENAAFTSTYGYSNAIAFDYKVLQPRVSFEYTLPTSISWVNSAVLRGGAGLFLGRFPNVWLGNAYSRPGPLSDYPTYRSYDPSIGPMPAATAYDGSPRFFWLKSAASTYTIPPPGSSSASQYVSPDFQGPNSWRENIALDVDVFDGYQVSFEVNHDKVRKAIAYRDPGLTRTGTLADGRGTYSTSGSLELTNTNLGHATAFTFSVKKTWFDSLDAMFAYTHTSAKDIWDLTSSQAESSYGYQQRWDGDNLALTPSQYEIEHRFIATLQYTRQFFGNNDTKFSLIWNHHSGEPYSVTFDNKYAINNAFGHYGGYDLAYIPTGTTDPNVVFSSPTVASDVMAYVDSSQLAKYKGTYAPRDAFRDPWITRVDFRLTQEINLPRFWSRMGDEGANKAIVYVDVINLGNLLDKTMGIVREHQYNTAAIIKTNFTDSSGRFKITGVNPTAGLITATNAGQSSWQLRLGFKYEF